LNRNDTNDIRDAEISIRYSVLLSSRARVCVVGRNQTLCICCGPMAQWL